MEDKNVMSYIESVLKNMPEEWLGLTTHRLDIYDEQLAKTQFLERFETLYEANSAETAALRELPTAYDYIRLGHPLSSVLEWGIAKLHHINSDQVISFSSRTAPVLAVLRKNLLDKKNTRIAYSGQLPHHFDPEVLKQVYGYHFELVQVDDVESLSPFNGSTVYISTKDKFGAFDIHPNVDFLVTLHAEFGSVLLVNGEKNRSYISEIQHVRRRETIAMTPADCYTALQMLIGKSARDETRSDLEKNKSSVLKSIGEITGTDSPALLGSSGLSVQYAIMMGLIDDALENHPGKAIKFIVPPNCYGGTNDQARRVAACVENVEILDLPVDGDHDMVQSIDRVLDRVAKENAGPYIIAEIPTNPRVEVPDLQKLREALSKKRFTPAGETAVDPVFILDQTFCPNVQFCSEEGVFSSIRTISYVSGSKFPSGGKVTAGYCVANQQAKALMAKIDQHLQLCDNEATDFQVGVLAGQLPSMLQRIADAYKNTREFVSFIQKVLPEAKINFVSEELAQQGFTPSVFSLDLPTRGNTHEEREAYKRDLNLELINLMIQEMPDDTKYCVSYGQLKGSYWTIPATSTQGTTQEADKDYIARVSLSPDMDMEGHKKVFMKFVEEMKSR